MTQTTMPFPEFGNFSFVTPHLAIGGDISQDDGLAAEQLAEIESLGITHIVDCRYEWDDQELFANYLPDIAYLHHGMDDAGQRVPMAWFEAALTWIEEAGPDAIFLVHCHMGINRGPSLGFAVLLHQGWDPVDAITAIRAARPIANVWYADDALRWHHARRMRSAKDDIDRLAAWREDNPLDVVRVIREQRSHVPTSHPGTDTAEADFPPQADDLTDEAPFLEVMRSLADADDPRKEIVQTLAAYCSSGKGAGLAGSGVLGTTDEGQTFSVVREDWCEATIQVRLPKNSIPLCQAVAGWVRARGAVASAALALEPLDPNSTLTEAQRQAWVTLLSHLQISFRTDLKGEDLLNVRRALAGQSEPYRMIRQTLAAPSGGHGLLLRTALRNSLTGRSTGDLESGHWASRQPDSA